MQQTTSNIRLGLGRVEAVPAPGPGFGGDGHTMSLVVNPNDYARNDPFIMLADDHLDLAPGAPVGAAHPHAGFEIATFLASGSIDEGDEGVLNEGDVLWTTTGRGVVHNEHAVPSAGARILQLWFTLPDSERFVEPHFQVVRRNDAPVRAEPGVVARVYSGSSGDSHFKRREQVPITMVDFVLQSNAAVDQIVPSTHNGFLYMLEGSVQVDDKELRAGQIGWLTPSGREDDALLTLTASSNGARVVFYAGARQGTPIATHGPFVGGSRADLLRMGRAYTAGEFVRMADLVQGEAASRDR